MGIFMIFGIDWRQGKTNTMQFYTESRSGFVK